jgi:hypothetical protein
MQPRFDETPLPPHGALTRTGCSPTLARMTRAWFDLRFSLFAAAIAVVSTAWAGVKDTPFLQDRAVHFTLAPELEGAVFRKLELERDGIVFVLTDRGVGRRFDDTLALDRSFRPLASEKPRDITLGPNGRLYYLLTDRWLSNGDAGKPLGHFGSPDQLGVPAPSQIAVAANGDVRLIGGTQSGHLETTLFRNNQRLHKTQVPARHGRQVLYAHGNDFFLLSGDTVIRFTGTNHSVLTLETGRSATCLAFRNDEMFVGTTNGYFALSLRTGQRARPLQTRLPCVDITQLRLTADSLWAGTKRGAFHQHRDGRIDYYASKRWLLDDEVIDLQLDRDGNAYVLTKAGLTQIEFRPMTLAEKAAHYERKIRQRHIRFGFCSELRLLRPGDITSAEMIDTDNDGTWSNYYMASQAFHHAVTGEEPPRRHAWEAFEAFERQQTIHPLDGFPARTFERRGFKFSDPERWHPTADGDWEWKAHTSSDEIIAHTFGYSVLYECAAKTDAERQRIAALYDKIAAHIVRNNLYLIDVDGQPTLWGRWNPEYVNWYPHSIFDRRLNSAEIIAILQFAYKITGKDLYRAKAYELMEQHGYLENILSSMKLIQATPGYVFRGDDMGNEWNHSDDCLAFDTYWVLHRYAFTDELRAKFRAAIRDHFEIEQVERNPYWNFVYASTGATEFDLDGALWTLREFPLDLIDWTVHNSHRRDVTRLPAKFRNQQTAELLPPDERRIMRWNGNPFVLDGGNGGHTELAGDEFLLPYWMGRYLKLIE